MMELLVLSSILLLTGFVFLLNGRFVRRNILFSVLVPETETDNKVIQIVKSNYVKRIVILSLIFPFILFVLSFLISNTGTIFMFVVLLHLEMIAAIFIYKQAHDHLKRVKIREQWMTDIKVVKSTDTSLISESTVIPHYLFIAQLIALIIAFIYVGLNYNSIPETIATHWNFDGKADDFSKKSFFSIFGPGLFGIFILFILWASSKSIDFFNTTVHPSAKSASLNYIKQTKLINSMMIHLISFTMTALFILLLIRPIMFDADYLPNGVFNLMMGILFLITFVCIYLQVAEDRKFRKAVAAAPSNKEPYFDEDHYIMGVIYYNKQDSNLMVPKLSGMGMTFNMAKPVAWFAIFLLVALPIFVIVLIEIFG